jgi:hypothetical protein
MLAQRRAALAHEHQARMDTAVQRGRIAARQNHRHCPHAVVQFKRSLHRVATRVLTTRRAEGGKHAIALDPLHDAAMTLDRVLVDGAHLRDEGTVVLLLHQVRQRRRIRQVGKQQREVPPLLAGDRTAAVRCVLHGPLPAPVNPGCVGRSPGALVHDLVAGYGTVSCAPNFSKMVTFGPQGADATI